MSVIVLAHEGKGLLGRRSCQDAQARECSACSTPPTSACDLDALGEAPFVHLDEGVASRRGIGRQPEVGPP